MVELSKWGETLRRLATNMRLSSTVRLFECSLVEVPTVVGWMKPAILLPAGMVMGMAPVELEAILAHELAHVRRLDYAVNLIQVWAESWLFFHPAAWWISSRIRAEREHCCDDEAVAACGDAVV